jgi:tetrahydromethanopterin S-methyltransferase subunit H
MAGRKKSGLSGSAAHHKALVEGSGWDVPNYYTDAVHEAEDGLCGSALRSLQTGAEGEGIVRTHIKEARMTYPGLKLIDAAREKAHAAIGKHCLVKGKLSGLRRRRKARR